jgi:hypothetical protein
LNTQSPVSLGELDLWSIHVARCTAVLRRALELMAEDEMPSPANEVALNRAMYWCILTAQRELSAQGQAPLAPVIPEGRNPPAASDAERTTRENKIPDFQWGLTDDHVADVRLSARHFVVECKCLFRTRRRDWIYTEQYVIAGVRRFVTTEHGYGMGSRDGAMVGYVHELTFDEARTEVGAHVAREGLPPVVEMARWGEGRIELMHSLDRSFDESPFQLSHLWQRF